ncbi:MAG: efflux RND transporter periplasmic adaptor subunit [Clostridiales bacterium]|nr:efflux RND transporter periplasmic adaptor subunit [Clostridiales bacterium]
MKRKFAAALMVAVLAMSIAGCGAKTDDVIQEDPATAVSVMTAEKTEISNEFLYSGTVEPITTLNVSGKISGKVAQVNFDVGDFVKEGDVLYQMDTTDILNNKKVAEASLVSARANINSAQTNLDLVNGAGVQTQIDSAKSGLDQAKIALDTAQNDYDNNKVLFQNGIISQTQMDAYTDALNRAKISYDSAQQSYDLLVSQMTVENKQKAQAALEVAQSSVASIQAQLDTYNQALKDATVTAPISGYVTACNVKKGEMLSTASIPFTLVDTSSMTINVSVSDTIINSIKKDDEVSVTITSLGKDMKGTVETVNPAANSGGTYDVKVRIENANGELKAGMFGQVNFTKDKKDAAIVVPVDAVLTKQGETYVFINENGVAKKAIVEQGISDGTNVEITSGVTSGDEVIIKGQNFIEDGDKITVEAEAGSTEVSSKEE